MTKIKYLVILISLIALATSSLSTANWISENDTKEIPPIVVEV